MEILVLSFLFATGKFILICRFMPIRKVLYFDKYIDLFFTLVLPMAFYGTFSGVITAIFSGLFLSLYLMIAKFFFGSEPPDWVKRRIR